MSWYITWIWYMSHIDVVIYHIHIIYVTHRCRDISHRYDMCHTKMSWYITLIWYMSHIDIVIYHINMIYVTYRCRDISHKYDICHTQMSWFELICRHVYMSLLPSKMITDINSRYVSVISLNVRTSISHILLHTGGDWSTFYLHWGRKNSISWNCSHDNTAFI